MPLQALPSWKSKSMANAFDNMAGRMDELTAKRLGRVATINGDEHVAVESHLLPELGPVAGDGINLVVFSAGYHPARGDEVIYKGQVYTVNRHHTSLSSELLRPESAGIVLCCPSLNRSSAVPYPPPGGPTSAPR
ncbi:hypothetical protein [Klebsiella pasteurii]|uniref:hypothetical protein n=1 Tax=Klebsiella pasteurii TaxID=2587529 RepID=UPI0039A202D4